MSADKKTHVLPWYIVVLFTVVTVVALSMTWYSMMDLGTDYLSLPVWLSVGVSLAFDGGAIFLSWLSVQYAKTTDSGFWTEVFAFAFIGTGVYIVVQHAVLADYPTAGIVMFASAPIIVGIMLKATLNYFTRQSRKAAGRVTDKLPSVGWLTWIRYSKETWKLMSVAMQGRLVNAADRLELVPDKHKIFGQDTKTPKDITVQAETIVSKTKDTPEDNVLDSPETKQQLSQPVPKPVLTSADNMSLPVWMPNEPTMSLATLAKTCLDNGVLDIETMYRYAVLLKGQDVNKMSLSKALTRQRTKMS